MSAIHEVIEHYFQAWNDAFASKNGETIRALMSERFVGYWAHSELDVPDQYDYTYDINAVLQQYGDAHKSFEILSVAKRKVGEEFLVIGNETNMINGIPHQAKCMFIWRLEGNDWKLVREYIELEK